METRASMCRSCNGYCPIDVTLDEGRVVKVAGNYRAPLYHGFICPKGRSLTQLHNNPDRLLTSLKKQPDGSFLPISTADLVAEISDRVGHLIEDFGPRSIATYLGGGVVDQPAATTFMRSFTKAIGSPNFFTAATIDQPGGAIADALHGRWMGGRQRPESWDVFLIVGGNPMNSKQYLPQNPGLQIKALRRKGTKFIVIDPRRTETAKFADVHLQPFPGEDPTILAGLIHLILAKDGVNQAFTAQNAEGIDELAEVVASFTPAYVAARAGIGEAVLHAAAAILIEARSGDIVLGTGPNMATRGNLSAYLGLCLQTLRGFWAGEGEEVTQAPVLLPPRPFKAQPSPPRPAWGFGLRTRVRGLEMTMAGMPLAALPEEILMPGEGQIKALFVHGGIMQSWPQQSRTIEALRALDLLVIHDYTLTPTARMADYVIATKLQFEVPSLTILNEMIGAYVHPGYGHNEPYAAYQPAVMTPPAGADVLESWQIYYRMAQRLSLSMKAANWVYTGSPPPIVDMEREPTTDEVYAMMCQGSTIPIEEVMRHPDGNIFDEVRRYVGPRDPICSDRLQLADPEMMRDLRAIATESVAARRRTDAEYPFQLIPSRMQNSQNSSLRMPGVVKTGYNPAWMNPRDMDGLALKAGDAVAIRSRHGKVSAFVEPDAGLRAGVVALMHGFGGMPGKDYDPRRDGANVNQLTSWDDDGDPHHGMPRMGALPVAVTPLG